jgi:hypothetical protein
VSFYEHCCESSWLVNIRNFCSGKTCAGASVTAVCTFVGGPDSLDTE